MSKKRRILGVGSVISALTETIYPLSGVQRLDEIGFVWDPLEEAWEEGFAALKNFKAREGDCNVPKLHMEGTFKLGQWVGVRRQRRDTMPAARRHRLDAIGFIWDTLESRWEEGFAALMTFKTREGDCCVRRGFVEGTFKLGGGSRTATK